MTEVLMQFIFLCAMAARLTLERIMRRITSPFGR